MSEVFLLVDSQFSKIATVKGWDQALQRAEAENLNIKRKNGQGWKYCWLNPFENVWNPEEGQAKVAYFLSENIH